MFIIQIFEIFGTILLKDQGVSQQLDSIDKKASGTSKSMGLSFGSIAGAALKVASVLGAGMGLKDMLDSASLSQQRMAQMDAVLKSTGGSAGMTKDELLKLAEAQGKVTTFSKGTNMETENLLLTFTGISSKVFPDVLKATNNMATAMGTDAKGAAMQLGKALNDPANGVSKLTRVGVTFTDAQKAQIKAMQDAGDTAGAQKVMLAELDKEFGNSAEAAGSTFGGQLKILQNQVKGVGGSIMSNVMPALTGFISNINNNMPKIKQVISDVINAIVPKFQTWIKLIGDIVKDLLPNLGKQVDGVKGKTGGFTSILDGVSNTLQFVRDNINFVKIALAILGAAWILQTGYVTAHNAVMLIHNAQTEAAAIKSGILTVAHGAHTAALGIATAAQWLFNAALSANPIGIVIIAIVALVAAFAILWTKSEGFRNFFIGMWNGIKSAAQSVGNWFSHDFVNFFVNAWKGLQNAFNIAISWIKNLPSQAVQWGKDFIMGLVNGIKSMIGSVVNAVSGVADKIKSFLHFSVPDEGSLTDYETWMPDFMQGLATGIDKNKDKVTNAIKGLSAGMSIGVKASVSGSATNTTASNNGASSSQANNGDIIIPISIDGKYTQTVTLTSQQIAQAQRQRAAFKGVTA